jgi:hypothetical protein
VRHFASPAACAAHLEQLGINGLQGSLAPARVATEGALWGSIAAHGLLRDAVVVSDDAGQFDVGPSALCWVHAERLPAHQGSSLRGRTSRLLSDAHLNVLAASVARPRFEPGYSPWCVLILRHQRGV